MPRLKRPSKPRAPRGSRQAPDTPDTDAAGGGKPDLPPKLDLPNGKRIETAIGPAAIGQLSDRELLEELLEQVMRLREDMDL